MTVIAKFMKVSAKLLLKGRNFNNKYSMHIEETIADLKNFITFF